MKTLDIIKLTVEVNSDITDKECEHIVGTIRQKIEARIRMLCREINAAVAETSIPLDLNVKFQ